MSIKSKSDTSYLYLLKLVEPEMINIDMDIVKDKERLESYVNELKGFLGNDNDRNKKIRNMVNTFLEGYEFELYQSTKVVCGFDKEYRAMVDFLSPYLLKRKHSSHMSNIVTQGTIQAGHSFAYEVGFLIYDRLSIKIPKKHSHLMKIKDKERYEILSENLSDASIIKYIMKEK